jgi:hypothetical protein
LNFRKGYNKFTIFSRAPPPRREIVARRCKAPKPTNTF